MEGILLNTARFTREGRELKKTKINEGRAGEADVYKYREALNFAHSVGLKSLEAYLIPELCDAERGIYVARATASFEDGSFFSEVGDADRSNTNSMVGKHLPRMAATRAKARALGDALNLDAVFKDEIGGDDGEPVVFTPRQEQPRQSSGQRQADNPPEFNGIGEYVCEDCGDVILDTPKYSAAIKAQWSIRDFNRILCYKCGKGKK